MIHPSKHKAFTQCCFNVGPTSKTVDQPLNNIVWLPPVCWDALRTVGMQIFIWIFQWGNSEKCISLLDCINNYKSVLIQNAVTIIKWNYHICTKIKSILIAMLPCNAKRQYICCLASKQILLFCFSEQYKHYIRLQRVSLWHERILTALLYEVYIMYACFFSV